MLIQTIGNYSLNISMVTYIIMYLPQLYHNNKGRLTDLSLLFHGLLIFYYLTDLMYGFGLLMPWQYRLVSVVGFVCLLIQHLQLFKIYRNKRYFIYSTYGLCLFGIFGFFSVFYAFTKTFFIVIGYFSQVIGLFYTIPQIYKNIGSCAALSLNIGYLGLVFICSSCDNISAWTLHWPTPSKFGAIIRIFFVSILIFQWFLSRQKYYDVKDAIIDTTSLTEYAR